MFEVDLKTMRNEIESRINTMLQYIFSRFQSTLMLNSS
jgi:hypothetical protein